ncbi:MAG: glycosyltransferase family 2 protein [Desulfobacula sp.]|jgi:cellulose synthase/poly-beta-1,6-N-acetylglucosamine synthase-like glycosyltransferase|nr:glycosyltransferase family 2 protein [Desulfobacula sp.]
MNWSISLFLLSVLIVFHAYFVYPLSLLVVKLLRNRGNQRQQLDVPVTLIITAYNEEKRIKEKLENTLKLNYPEELLQILVASDGSIDATNDIVRLYENQGIELLEILDRGGKENAQKEAVKYAKGEIFVFSDAATILEPHGLMAIVSNFADPTVGCASSEDRLIGQNGKPSGEGFYVQYEMWLRRLESQVNSIVGLSGSFFAARKEVCQDFSGDVQSDFRTLLNSMKKGLRGVSDPEAIGSYLNITDEKREFERKVRTVVRGLTVFFKHVEFLNIFQYGLFSYQFFCHKLLRWLVPFFLISALASNVILSVTSDFFLFLLAGQLVFYGIGVYGWITQSLNGVLKIPMFFMVVNIAIAAAWWQYIAGKRVVLWEPSQR